jgi:guanylate kinase
VIPKNRGLIYVVSAPSGAGKTTLCHKAVEALPGLVSSVSFTTRPSRPGEIPDQHYSFIDQDEFRARIAGGEFVEWAEVHSNFYGTSRKRIESVINRGNDVILDIDVQGARNIREHYPECIQIFVLPPSMEVLEKRLFDRKSDSAEVIDRRLKKAQAEIKEYKHYDYVIVNDALEEAFAAFLAILTAECNRVAVVDHEWITEHFLKEE